MTDAERTDSSENTQKIDAVELMQELGALITPPDFNDEINQKNVLYRNATRMFEEVLRRTPDTNLKGLREHPLAGVMSLPAGTKLVDTNPSQSRGGGSSTVGPYQDDTGGNFSEYTKSKKVIADNYFIFIDAEGKKRVIPTSLFSDLSFGYQDKRAAPLISYLLKYELHNFPTIEEAVAFWGARLCRDSLDHRGASLTMDPSGDLNTYREQFDDSHTIQIDTPWLQLPPIQIDRDGVTQGKIFDIIDVKPYPYSYPADVSKAISAYERKLQENRNQSIQGDQADVIDEARKLLVDSRTFEAEEIVDLPDSDILDFAGELGASDFKDRYDHLEQQKKMSTKLEEHI